MRKDDGCGGLFGLCLWAHGMIEYDMIAVVRVLWEMNWYH